MDKNSVFAEFVHQVRSGNAFQIVGSGIGETYRSNHMFDIASFDFSGMDDMTSPEILPQDKRDLLWEDWLTLREQRSFHFPFSECAYIFHWREAKMQNQTINLFHIRQSPDGDFTIRNYSKEPRLSGSQSKWLRHPLPVRFKGRELDFSNDLLDLRHFNFEDQERFMLDRQANFSKAILATLLLRGFETDAKEGDVHKRVNAGRERAGMPTIPATLTVKYDKPVRVFTERGESRGRVLTPHDRRGHYRRLRSGRMVPIRACRIHDGGDTLRSYRVTGGAHEA